MKGVIKSNTIPVKQTSHNNNKLKPVQVIKYDEETDSRMVTQDETLLTVWSKWWKISSKIINYYGFLDNLKAITINLSNTIMFMFNLIKLTQILKFISLFKLTFNVILLDSDMEVLKDLYLKR